MNKSVAFRPFYGTVDPDQKISAKLAHPFFAFCGMRPLASQHSKSEDFILRKYASLAKETIVEIGVAEGASALAMRESMPNNACLYLLDPYKTGRIPFISMTFLAAQKYVEAVSNGSVIWIKDFSFNAVKKWDISRKIDLLFIDGDHSESGCLQDWKDWNPYVQVGGHVIFHDARLFSGGWPKEEDGPVRVVNQLFREQSSSEWKIIEEVNSIVVVQRKI